ncbi:Pre-rRNA-processing protein PNO1 [Aureobasidium subglaciale]|nr:Pre-rRNA-processing protein PNO1 [Aureobasidium subglaciale]
MPAPTALQRVAPEEITQNLHETPSAANDEDEFMISTTDAPAVQVADQPSEDTAMTVDSQPLFAAEKATNQVYRAESRKVAVPPHRWTPLKNAWPKIYPPLVEHLKLQCRVNIKSKAVELRTSPSSEAGSLQRGADFITAFTMGFDLDDAIALLRLDDLYIETFEIKDVKTLVGEHKGRAIGRIAGKDGKTKHAIENASKTRVVLADSKIHILGGFKNIHMARTAIVSLILGSPPAKVYGNLRTVASRMKERF